MVNVVWQLAEVLVRDHGCAVFVACDFGSELRRLDAVGAVHVPVPFDRGPRSFLRARRALARLYRRERPEVIHSHSRWPSMVSVAAGRRPDVSTLHAQVLTGHGSTLDRGIFRRLLSRWGDRVTVLDDEARRMLAATFGLDPARIEVVPNGVDQDRFRPPSAAERAGARARLGLSTSDRVMLFVGEMTAGKRVRWCLEALATAIRSCRDAKLLLLGDGAERRLCEDDARTRGLLDRCRFLGWSDDPLPSYWASDVLLLPSASEGFGLVCVEAMMCGVPCVRTWTGGARAQVIDGVTGWGVAGTDVAEFAEIAARVVRDPTLCAHVGAAAREHAASHFDASSYVRRMVDVYMRSRRGRAS